MRVKDFIKLKSKKVSIYVDKDGNTISVINEFYSTVTADVEEMEIKEIQIKGGVIRLEV